MTTCWKCGLPITAECPDDGLEYTSAPPQYAHKKCTDPKLNAQTKAEEGKPGVMLPPQVISDVVDGRVEIDVSPHTDFATGKLLPPGMLSWRVRRILRNKMKPA